MFDVSSMQFPVLGIIQDGGGFSSETSYDELTKSSKLAAARGLFCAGMLLIESTGRAVRLKGAREVPGSASPWWNFWNPSVRVNLIVDGEPFSMTLDEVKETLLENSRRGWCPPQPDPSDEEYKRETDLINNAQSIGQIIREHPP
jgi:hypothetical protein